MKLLSTLMVSLCLVGGIMAHDGTTGGIPTDLNPNNTILAFDLEGVLVKKNKRCFAGIMAQGVAGDTQEYMQGLQAFKNSMSKDAHGNSVAFDTEGNRYNGATTLIIHNAIINPALRQYAANMSNLIGNSFYPITGIPSLLRSLKNMGYSLCLGTNKDGVAVANLATNDQCRDVINNTLFDAAVVHYTHGAIMIKFQTFLTNNINKITASFKNLIEQFIVQDSANDIPFLPTSAMKTEKEYYEALRQVHPTKTIILFDDQLKNVEAANRYGKEIGIYGVHVRNTDDITTFLKEHNMLNHQ